MVDFLLGLVFCTSVCVILSNGALLVNIGGVASVGEGVASTRLTDGTILRFSGKDSLFVMFGV